MRNLVYAINITIDGCCDHTKVTGSDQILEHFSQLLREMDLQVFGRKTYELMVPYWPEVAKDPSSSKADLEFAKAFDSVPRIVVSKSLAAVGDKNTKILRGNLGDEILKLKQQAGKKILLGGVNVSSQLIELDLVDEFHFVVQPCLVGVGTRLLEGVNLPQTLNLKLAYAKPLNSNGCVVLHYLKQ